MFSIPLHISNKQVLQKGFVKLANSRKNSYMIIDSNLEIEKNKKSILEKIKKLI